MIKKIIFAVIEFVTIAIGTGLFVTNTLKIFNSSYNSYSDDAGVGAFMVVLGLLFRVWKNEFFEINKNNKIENENIAEPEIKKTKPLIVGVFFLFAFTIWAGSSAGIKKSQSEINSVEDSVSKLERSVEMIKKDIDYLSYLSSRNR